MVNALRRISFQVVSNSRMWTLALALGVLIINAPIGGGGGGY